MREEDDYQKQRSDDNKQLLNVEARLRKAELDNELLKKDKESFLHELSLAKEKEHQTVRLWEGLIQN